MGGCMAAMCSRGGKPGNRSDGAGGGGCSGAADRCPRCGVRLRAVMSMASSDRGGVRSRAFSDDISDDEERVATSP